MVLYFSGTGNCLAIAKKIAAGTDERVMSLYEGAETDLSQEKVVGLVYPTYYFNAPAPVHELVKSLSISKDAYVFVVIPCGAQTGNAIWSVARILRSKGVSVAYCHKIRVPDCSAIGFGRDPNVQKWKFDRYAYRLEKIISDIRERRHAHHFGAWGLAGWLCAQPWMERKTQPLLQPAVNKSLCTGCGTCAKICPQENISLVGPAGGNQTAQGNEKGSTALIGDKCAQCLRCVHFCPQQAIEIAGKPTPKQHQYHHPEIKLKDLL